MKNIFLKPLLLAGLFFIAAKAQATIKLPAIFGDNMVFQQQAQDKVWGWAKANSAVTVVTGWDNKVYKTTSGNDGSWWLKVTTPKAGGPYQISFSDGQVLTLKNVMVGEVWFCSGQSNIEMELKGNSSPILNASEIILNADNPQLRLMTIKTQAPLTPAKDFQGRWDESTSETARNFSAIAWQYGQILQKKLHVPVGIIVSACGGTIIEAWMSKGSLAPFSEVSVPTNIDTVQKPWKLPTMLFNGKIAPVMVLMLKVLFGTRAKATVTRLNYMASFYRPW